MNRRPMKYRYATISRIAETMKISEATVKRWIRKLLKDEIFLVLEKGKWIAAVNVATYTKFSREYRRRKNERVS